MALTRSERWAIRLFGPAAGRSGPLLRHLGTRLPQALVFVRPERYLAWVYLHAAVAFTVALAAVSVLFFATGGPLPGTVLWVLPVVAAAIVGASLFLRPAVKAAERANGIDNRLPYALNYVATMAAAGMPPERIFYSLSEQPVYGEVANEAALIDRDISGFGMDLQAALQNAVSRSPSRRMRALLQGAVTTLATGDNLARYFLAKSRQFADDNREKERKFLDLLGVLAESYVTLVVAGPVFIIVLLSVMMVLGSGPAQTLAMGYLLVLLLVPLAQVGFATTIDLISPEV